METSLGHGKNRLNCGNTLAFFTGTHRWGDTSVWGHIGVGTHRYGDTSVWGQIGVGTHQCGDTSVWGDIGLTPIRIKVLLMILLVCLYLFFRLGVTLALTGDVHFQATVVNYDPSAALLAS